MEVKILEIRDRATMIAALCVDMNPGNNLPGTETPEGIFLTELWYLRKYGYAGDGRPNIGITHLAANGTKFTNDPYEWGGRTWPVAHNYIIEHWDELQTGDVIDVEFILGETDKPKVSERFGG